MNRTLGRTLTDFFAANATRYPFFTGEAVISRVNAHGTSFSATAKTPAQTAEVLRLFSSGGLFDPGEYMIGGAVRASFDIRHAPENPRGPGRTMRGVNMIFGEAGRAGLFWHYESGGQYFGPDISETIDILSRAGNRWNRVNFIPRPDGSHLRFLK